MSSSSTALVLTAGTIAWNLGGELSAASQSIPPGRSELAQLPSPADWIDAETGKARTLYFGYAMQNSDAFWTLEFWNQSIQDVWSVDASAPPPGPDDDAELPRHRRSDRPAAPGALGRRAAGDPDAGTRRRERGRPEPLPRAAARSCPELRLGADGRRLDAAGDDVRPLRGEARAGDARRSRSRAALRAGTPSPQRTSRSASRRCGSHRSRKRSRCRARCRRSST